MYDALLAFFFGVIFNFVDFSMQEFICSIIHLTALYLQALCNDYDYIKLFICLFIF